MPNVITTVTSVAAARSLPAGTVVGDLYGGVTFDDSVAAVLEARSRRGWREVFSTDECWTVIVIDR